VGLVLNQRIESLRRGHRENGSVQASGKEHKKQPPGEKGKHPVKRDPFFQERTGTRTDGRESNKLRKKKRRDESITD